MSYNSGKYFPPGYFAPRYWTTGGEELPEGFMQGSAAGVATVAGLVFSCGVNTLRWGGNSLVWGSDCVVWGGVPGALQGSANGSSTATGTLTSATVVSPQEPLLQLGNLGFGENFWPASQKREKKKKLRKGALKGFARGTSHARGRITARNIEKEKQIVKEIISRYENSVAAEIDEDDEETLLMMW